MSDFTTLFDNNTSSLRSAELLGQKGEALAAEYLAGCGYRIVLTNFKVPVGRNSQGAQVTGEIDIVALDEKTLCFVEVKTRRSADFTPIITAVDLRKQRQITRTAKIYRRIFGVFEMPYRFDVVTVLIAAEKSSPRGGAVEHRLDLVTPPRIPDHEALVFEPQVPLVQALVAARDGLVGGVLEQHVLAPRLDHPQHLPNRFHRVEAVVERIAAKARSNTPGPKRVLSRSA